MTSRNYEVFVQQENCPPGGCEEPFFVYPNPTSDELVVTSGSNRNGEDTDIILLDANGGVVYSSTVKANNQVRIPVREYKEGVYYLSVTEKGKTKKHRIIINH